MSWWTIPKKLRFANSERRSKADTLYALKICYVLLVEGLHPKKALLRTLAESKWAVKLPALRPYWTRKPAASSCRLATSFALKSCRSTKLSESSNGC